MQKIRINDWQWMIETPALLHGWFDHWEDFARNSAVKQNPVRTVFKVEDLFYVKIEQPAGFWRRARNRLAPKAAREFAAGRALATAGVPVVRHLGWAKRGSAVMLLTEALPESCSALEYWHREIVYGPETPKKFLTGLAEFLNPFFAAGFYHPDFHLGNLLYCAPSGNFALVDVYGVRRPKKLSPRQITEHSRIVLELFRGLSNAEGSAFLRSVRSELSAAAAGEFWRRGLALRAARAQENWPKRRVQILENYSKYITPVNTADHEFLVRKMPGAGVAVDPPAIPDRLTGNYFDVAQLPSRRAEALWLESFRLELLGVDHLRPLVFEKPGVLYFEKPPDGARKASPDSTAEFIDRARTAGIEIDPAILLQLPNNRVVAPLMLLSNGGQ
ncbi:MAG: lipopolysaccharide kinase InaA family protein [Victivallaceae bacterium]|nr:lipopolysaccharide kinase InaA family protein [Victivallaceae bacterium]